MNNPSLLSVDVEDGINIAMRDHFNVLMPPTERVIKNTSILLDLFAKHNTKGTFFILGEIAAHYPDLIKKIDSAGHEIGIHGYSHIQYFKMTSKEVKMEISETKKLLEDITGKEVIGHRAPAFSILPSNAWVLEIIAELGLKYDSSIVPAQMGRYGWEGFNKEIVRLNIENGNSLIEVPLSTISIAGKTIPAGGGGYLRYFPFFWSNYCIRTILKQRPAMVYLHPYEIDTEDYPEYFFEAAKNKNIIKRLKSRAYKLNKHTVFGKLDKLLKNHQFLPIAELLKTMEKKDLPIINLAKNFKGVVK